MVIINRERVRVIDRVSGCILWIGAVDDSQLQCKLDSQFPLLEPSGNKNDIAELLLHSLPFQLKRGDALEVPSRLKGSARHASGSSVEYVLHLKLQSNDVESVVHAHIPPWHFPVDSYTDHRKRTCRTENKLIKSSHLILI